MRSATSASCSIVVMVGERVSRALVAGALFLAAASVLSAKATTTLTALIEASSTSSAIAAATVSLASTAPASTIEAAPLRWRRGRSTGHELADVIRSLERLVKFIFRLVVVVVTHASTVCCFWRVARATADEGFSAVVARCAKRMHSSAIRVEVGARQASSTTSLGRLLQALVFCLFLIIREFHLIWSDFFIVYVARVGAFHALQRLREDELAVLVNVVHLRPERQALVFNLFRVVESNTVHGLLDTSECLRNGTKHLTGGTAED